MYTYLLGKTIFFSLLGLPLADRVVDGCVDGYVQTGSTIFVAIETLSPPAVLMHTV